MGDQTDQADLAGTGPSSARFAPHAWSILLISLLVWWPVASYWQSDDFMALHYTTNWANTWSDFVGGQYGLESLVIFYRPLITLSFALEQALGSGAQPFLSHFTNILAHGISAVCLAAIVRRFATPRQAFAAGLLWALAPSHAGSLFWAVGRVDSHTTMWIALSTLLFVQWCEGSRPSRWPALVCFVLALLSKELAWVMPGIALVFGFIMTRRGSRLSGALQTSWPFLALLLVYFGLRTVLLGGILTGYSSELQIQESLVGLGVHGSRLLNPLLHSGLGFSREFLVELPGATSWLGFIPACLAIAAMISGRRLAFATAALVLFVGCSVPILQLWADTTNPLNLRLFYLPMMPLAGLLALGGWRSAAPALLVFALPLAEIRTDYQGAWQQCEALHGAIRTSATAELNFVADLPSVNQGGTALQFHLGVDRLTREPFAESKKAVYALRPLNQNPESWSLPYGAARAMPFGATFGAKGLDILPSTAAPKTANLELRLDGPEMLSNEVLDQIVKNYQAKLQGKPTTGQDPVLTLLGQRGKRYRVTILTANGYLTTFLDDTAKKDSQDGRIEVGPILMGKLSSSDGPVLGDLLQRATALDLSCRFPILVEADLRPDASSNDADFQATHANQRPLWVKIDRLFANWWPN
ncbi:MAG: hypothetical protein VX951_07580 [Planctomycetota bacterium]|nr:hypothetical protein [Planctomycetota bacterium]